MLSIIVPHKNSSKLIKKLLSSIPDDDGIQVIVVDDKSTDKEKENLRNILDERNIQIISNDLSLSNAGVARNIGINHAIGEWVLFADADDYFTEGSVQKLLNHLSFSKAQVVLFNSLSCLPHDNGRVVENKYTSL